MEWTSPEGGRFDTDVLVVGTGPAGATCALALATQGVGVRVVTKRPWLADSPRAHITNQRALEVLRDLGVEEQAARVATPWELMGEMVLAESLAGPEVARLRTWGWGEDRRSEYLRGSPCPLLDIPQPLLEPVLVENAAARGAEVRFSTEYLSHVQDADGVTTTLRDRLTGTEHTVRSRYLVGADGARSRVVEDLGLPLEGTMGRAGTVYVRFTADLTRHVAHRPGILHRILLPAFGEIGMTTLRAVRPWSEWIAGWGYDLAGPAPDTRPEAVLPRVRAVIGDPDVAVDVVDVATWQVNQVWATRYSAGRVFCAGDAVHRHPPSSGLGSNTSIQDAFNLAWKLTAVCRGWAGPGLLDSYTEERAPVGEQVVARANRSRADYAPLNDVLAAVHRAAAEGRRLLDEPSDEGVRAREALVHALDRKNEEFNGQGTELNQRYVSRAVVPDPAAPEEELPADGLHLVPSTRPGAKLPHAWLVDRAGHRISTLDVVGRGRFSLVTGIAGTAWVAAVRELGLPFLRAVVIGAPGLQDVYADWSRLRDTAEAGALLVRPDGYVAWRHAAAEHDRGAARAALESVLGAVLGKPVPEASPSPASSVPY
ncbi:FAD-dependent oxidoreductase [Blastococcus sp. SYSU D00669]